MTKQSRYQYTVCIHCMTYNHKPYILDALHGFTMQQTKFPYVALVMDDDSTDGEPDVLRQYIAEQCDTSSMTMKDDELYELVEINAKNNLNCHFAFYFLKQNLWRTGKKKPIIAEWDEQAKYIALCEGDDYWTDPLKLQKQVDFLESHPEVGLCYTDYNVCLENQIVAENIFHNDQSRIISTFEEQLIKSAYMAPMTWLFRRDVYMQIAPTKSHADGTFALSLDFFARSNVAYLPETTAVYRSHIGSATTQVDPVKHWCYEKGVFETQLEYAEKYHCTPELIQNLKLQGYVDFLLPALEANDEDFVQEVINYYSSQGMELRFFVDRCKRYVRYHQQYEMIRQSKAYKLGKILLKPLKWLKR